MIELSEFGIQVLNFDKRQQIKPSDKPEATRERKRKQRAKPKESQEPMTRDVTPLSRPCHDTDKTRLDTDQIRSDKDQTLDISLKESTFHEASVKLESEGEQSQGEKVLAYWEDEAGQTIQLNESTLQSIPPINTSSFEAEPLHSQPPSVSPLPPSRKVLPFEQAFSNPNSRSWFEWQTGPGPNDYVPEFVDYLAKKWRRDKADVKRFLQKNRSNPEAISAYFDDFKELGNGTQVDDLVMKIMRRKAEEAQHGHAANW